MSASCPGAFVEAARLSWVYVRLVDYKRLQLDTI